MGKSRRKAMSQQARNSMVRKTRMKNWKMYWILGIDRRLLLSTGISWGVSATRVSVTGCRVEIKLFCECFCFFSNLAEFSLNVTVNVT